MKSISQKHYIEPDVLLVHKPVGMSSFDVIRRLRPVLGTRKIGHAGTLDPLASGLMILGINKGTKKLTQYLKLPKTYIAKICIGVSTTTGDAEGDIVDEKYVEKNDSKYDDLEDAVISMKGSYTLQVPLYSAIKVQGKALYQYAREGKTPPYIPEKEMTITAIQLLDSYRRGQYQIVTVRVEVSSGTYVRTLGEEFGRRIGYPASLIGLQRISIDRYLDADAYRFPRKKAVRNWIRDIIKLLFGKRKK